jgi:hypothetical protein
MHKAFRARLNARVANSTRQMQPVMTVSLASKEKHITQQRKTAYFQFSQNIRGTDNGFLLRVRFDNPSEIIPSLGIPCVRKNTWENNPSPTHSRAIEPSQQARVGEKSSNHCDGLPN